MQPSLLQRKQCELVVDGQPVIEKRTKASLTNFFEITFTERYAAIVHAAERDYSRRRLLKDNEETDGPSGKRFSQINNKSQPNQADEATNGSSSVNYLPTYIHTSMRTTKLSIRDICAEEKNLMLLANGEVQAWTTENIKRQNKHIIMCKREHAMQASLMCLHNLCKSGIRNSWNDFVYIHAKFHVPEKVQKPKTKSRNAMHSVECAFTWTHSLQANWVIHSETSETSANYETIATI
ncbi:hypothetical protein GQX74_015168 [Glossina fuscipes]|nr:hypothetical protein GQX74_015168 [Glossina fuscipes]